MRNDALEEFLNEFSVMLREIIPDEDTKNQVRILDSCRELRKYTKEICESYGRQEDVPPRKRQEALNALQEATSMLKNFVENN